VRLDADAWSIRALPKTLSLVLDFKKSMPAMVIPVIRSNEAKAIVRSEVPAIAAVRYPTRMRCAA